MPLIKPERKMDGTQDVKKQPSQDVLHGDKAEEELGLAHLVSSSPCHTRTHSLAREAGRQLAVKC